ncbi:synaptonemal complex protein 1-like isoform X1 [Vespa crabro]|uniref:synaptonemal complex protein 1-like isoform X1 n=1 Tax=Vespa crabro TaxID=7445 RepID=UPI001F02002D|nr:synaptonemal complex protein 1-like isoform X1 [Vespa crabro]XP_046830897.1 synaptonemal complex protein 1-like isoform X1 [Vespa crabro]
MCKSLLATRLTELNQQLATIVKLQKMEDEYDKSSVLYSKLCDCPHHILPTGENKKKISCNINTCKTRKRCTCLCQCNKTSKSYKNDEKSKEISSTQSYDDKAVKNNVHDTEIGQVCNTRLENVQDLEKIKSARKEIIQERIINKTDKTEDTSIEVPVQDNDKSKKPKEIMILSDDNDKDVNTEEIKILQDDNDLSNEKKQKRDLEEKLQNAKQHLTKLKENGEQQISFLKDALQKAEEQLAQAKKETITITADRDRLLQTVSTLKEEINNVIGKNVSLHRECQDLKCKLQTASECETKTCTVVQDEVNLIKSIVKQKEEILQAEIIELKGLIAELTNVTKIQERRICELTNICKKQQCGLRDKSKMIIEKESKIFEIQSLLKSYSCKCTGMQNDIQNLESTLNKESNTCNGLKEELERFKDDYNCMLNIKTKIIEEQDETIKKQKRLLQDSESMAQQAASEFEEIRNELVHEKETCESLRIALITAEVQLNQKYNVECKKCQNLIAEVNLLDQQKQKALIAAKEALRKLCISVRDYQRELVFERQQCKFLTLKLKEKQDEVEYIKKEFAYKKKTIVRRTSDFLS